MVEMATYSNPQFRQDRRNPDAKDGYSIASRNLPYRHSGKPAPAQRARG